MEEDALWWREVWKIQLGSFQGFFHLQSDPVLLLGFEDLCKSAEAMGLLGCESTFAFLHGYGQVENQTSEKKRIQIRWTGWKWDSESGDCPPQHAPSILDSFCTWSFAHAVSGRWVSIPPASLWSPTHRPTPTQLFIVLFSFFFPLSLPYFSVHYSPIWMLSSLSCIFATKGKTFPGGSDGKESSLMQETWVQSLGWEDPLAVHSSILAWRIPWTEEPGRLQSMGSQRVRHNWVTSTFTFTFYCGLAVQTIVQSVQTYCVCWIMH